jgi:hypothetical protein
MGRYKFEKKSDGSFALYEDGTFLIAFTRDRFQETMAELGRGKNWGLYA